MKKKTLVLLCLCALVGLGAAFAVADVPTTGTATACASVPAHTIADNSVGVYTIPGTTNCTTTTYTVPTVTNTTTVTTTVSSPAVALGGSLPAPLAQSTGSTVTISSLAAINSATPGQTVCLNSGTYGAGLTSALTISVSGTATSPITVTACPGQSPVIEQLLEITGSYLRFSHLVIDRNSYPTDSRFGQSGSNPGGNVGIWPTGSHVTIEHCEIRNQTMSGIFGGGSYDQILANWIHDNGTTSDDHGIYWTSDHGLIANNVIERNADFGIQLGYSGATANVIANNTLASNGVGHSWLGGGSVDFSGTTANLFVNDIAYDNGDVGYKTYDTGANSLSHDDAFGNPNGSTYGTFGSVTSLLTSNPLFVGVSDYHLQTSSPMLAAGDPAYTPATDYYGDSRSNADLGAIG